MSIILCCFIWISFKSKILLVLFIIVCNWFTRGSRLGVSALRAYVKEFAGEAFAKQINDDNVFNGVGEGENQGKASYYCALKIPEHGRDQ